MLSLLYCCVFVVIYLDGMNKHAPPTTRQLSVGENDFELMPRSADSSPSD